MALERLFRQEVQNLLDRVTVFGPFLASFFNTPSENCGPMITHDCEAA